MNHPRKGEPTPKIPKPASNQKIVNGIPQNQVISTMSISPCISSGSRLRRNSSFPETLQPGGIGPRVPR